MQEPPEPDDDMPEGAAIEAIGGGPVDLPVPDAEGDTVPTGEGGAAPDDPEPLGQAVRLAEALIFAAEKPVTLDRLQTVLGDSLPAGLVIEALRTAYEGRGVTLVEVAGGWAFRTAPDLAPQLTRVIEVPRRLPRVAMETLSIIAYHQPVTRAEIEEIRGASLSQNTLDALLEHGLIQPKGRKEVPGRPSLWGTTGKFLEQFGLRALTDLPRREELLAGEAINPSLSLTSPG